MMVLFSAAFVTTRTNKDAALKHQGDHHPGTIDLFSNLKIHQRNKKPTTKNRL
jgi:hypothetical protein